jgi:hypothetical protein
LSGYVLTKDFAGEHERLQLLETLRARIVDAGMLTEPELDDAQALLANPQFWDLGPAWVATWGTRPA